MDVYKTIEDSLYEAMETLFPDVEIWHAYENQPEGKTPYITIHVLSVDSLGREYKSGLTDEERVLTSIENFESLVRFEFVGSKKIAAGGLSQKFLSMLRHPNKNYEFATRKLSVMRFSSAKSIPKKRATEYYVSHVVDVFFAYSTAYSEEVATVESVVIDGELTPDGGIISIEISTEIE